MPKQMKSHEQWLDKNDDTQIKWTTDYIWRRGKSAFNIKQKTPYEDALWLLNQTPAIETNKNFIQKMRGDWSNYKFRNKPDVVIHNMALSKKATSELKRLAGKKPLNKTIEDIINGIYSTKNDYDKELSKIKSNINGDIKNHKNYLDNRYLNKDKKIWIAIHESEKGVEAQVSKEELLTLSIKVFYLIQKHAEYDIKLQDRGIKNLTLTEKQRLKAKEKQESLIESILGKHRFDVENYIRQLEKAQDQTIPDNTSNTETAADRTN